MTAARRALFVALVDLSAPGGGGGRAAALDRARLLLDTLFDGLAACAADGQLPWEFDVAAVGSRRRDGAAEVVPLLPGTDRAAVPLAGLLAAERPPRGEGEPRRWLADATPDGEAAADAGWIAAHRVVSRWLTDNSAARPPVVVRCAFGPDVAESQSAAERGVRALGRPDSPVVVFTHRTPDDEAAAELPVAAVWELLFADHPPRPDAAEPTPEAPPFQVVRAFHCEKLGNDPAQWEDGYAVDPASGRAAIADGASEGIYCRVWADLLSAGVVADAPGPARLGGWVSDRRAEWRRRIDYPKLNWSKQGKVDSTGAAATLLGLSVGPLTPAGGRVWRAVAVGDACLFWVRDGRLMLSFPLACGEQLGSAPDLLRTLAGRREPNPLTGGGVCRPGDLFLLATDAVAGHLFRLAEGGQPLARYADLSADGWRQEATDLRRNGGMVNDDCTLLVLRVTGPAAETPPAETTETIGEVDAAEPVDATDPPATADDDHAYSGA